jgi:TetR/AcrR family transcriptional regulator, regulator of cefoperazone and chloramphenicol sensitivity
MSGDLDTRERLVRAGEALFAERGFKRVTVREICLAARANVAAVNYHFGDKMGLYRTVVQSAIDTMCETTELARRAGDGRPPEEQLRRFIAIFLTRLLAPGHDTVQQLMHREMHDPTPALDAIVDQGIRPRIEYLSGVIARMTGAGADDDVVLRCVASIQSQALSYLHKPIASRLTRFGSKLQPTVEEVGELARHITAFSIAGVHAVTRAAEDARGRSQASRRRRQRAS